MLRGDFLEYTYASATALAITISGDVLRNTAESESDADGYAEGGGLNFLLYGSTANTTVHVDGDFRHNRAISTHKPSGTVKSSGAGGGAALYSATSSATGLRTAFAGAFVNNSVTVQGEAVGGGLEIRHRGQGPGQDSLLEAMSVALTGSFRGNRATSATAQAVGGGVAVRYFEVRIRDYLIDVTASFVDNEARGVNEACYGGGLALDAMFAARQVAGLRLAVAHSEFDRCAASSVGGFAGGGGLAVTFPSADTRAQLSVRHSGFRHNEVSAAAAGTA